MRLEMLVSLILFLGGGAGVALMLAGLVDLELHAPASRAVGVFVSLSALRRALDAWPPDPVAVITSGIVVLLLAPALGLGAALAGFLRERDRLYAAIAAVLMAALLAGFTLRLGG